MGFFTFFTTDTEESIPNNSQDVRPTFTVYMIDNKGNQFKEDSYEGYGKFGGKDFFELVDEMNGGTGDRAKGISRYFAFGCIMPNLVRDQDAEWVDVHVRQDNETQGFWYETEEEGGCDCGLC